MINNIQKKNFMQEQVGIGGREAIRRRFEGLLLRKGWRQRDLVKVIGIDKSDISKIVRGLIIPPIDKKIKIAQALDSDSAAIWNNEGDKR